MGAKCNEPSFFFYATGIGASSLVMLLFTSASFLCLLLLLLVLVLLLLLRLVQNLQSRFWIASSGT